MEMKILLDKSINSLNASILLKQEEHYASSVHCSYYSCVQLIRHILFNKLELDEKSFDNGKNTNQNGSHNHLLSVLSEYLHKSNIDVISLKSDFRIIKELRKNADYKQIIVFQNDCNNAYNLALRINNSLKTIYSI